MIINVLNICNFLHESKNGGKNNINRLNTTNPFISKNNLNADTISFSGAAKLRGEFMKYAPSYKMCTEVEDNARPAEFYLMSVLTKYIKIINEGRPFNKPLVELMTRIKKHSSIRDKAAAKYGDTIQEDKEKFCEIAVREIFKYIKPEKGCTQEMASSMAKIDYVENTGNIPPFGHEGDLINSILSLFEEIKFINTDNINPMEKNAIAVDIERLLKSKTSGLHCDQKGKYIDPATFDGIKHYVQDIVGARIVLQDSSPETVQKVINGLKRACRDGKFRITSIENFVPKEERLHPGDKQTNYEYIPERRLKHLAANIHSVYDKKDSNAGYLAIHVNIELSNDLLSADNTDFAGYKGEIQIIDALSEKLKGVEDLCYKLKANKNNIGEKYKKFKKYFNKHYNEDVKAAFEAYTYDLYLVLRKKAIDGNTGNNTTQPFPTIEELGYKGRVPEELDYNRLKELKDKCDKEHEELKQKQELEQHQKQEPKQPQKRGKIRKNFSLLA